MKKLLLSTLAIVAIATSAMAQNDSFEWKVGDNTKIKLGGYVRFNVNYDFDGYAGEANDFQPVKIANADWTDENYLNFDPTASRFSLEINQETKEIGNVKVFVEADFRNTSNAVRLRQAYIELCGFTAGYAWSFMSDLPSNAPTVDIMGVNSRTFLRTMLVGYRHNFSKELSGGIALEVPTLTTYYLTKYTAVNQTVPNIPIYLQYKGAMGHIKGAVVFRTLQYGVSFDQERTSSIGWGTQLSGSLAASSSVKLFGQAIYGKGINNYINDLSSLSINLMSEDNMTMSATPMGGASAGVSAKLSKKWSAAVSGSIVQNFGDEVYFEDNYHSGTYISTALFYAPAPRVTLGAEWLNGSRKDFGDIDATTAQRFSLMVKYTL